MTHESKRVEGGALPPALLGGSPPQAPPMSELDCRIYALVVLGEVMRWGLSTATVAGAIVGAVFLTPYLLFTIAISPFLIFLGCALANTIRWPDGTIHIPYLTSNAFIPGQPIGFRNGGQNCCVNSALQVAFASTGVTALINELDDDHPLKVILNGYKAMQRDGIFIANADTQLARLSISGFALPAPRRNGVQDPSQIDPNIRNQEGAGEILNFLLDQIFAQSRGRLGEDAVAPPYGQTIVKKATTRDGEERESRTHQSRLLLSLDGYLRNKRTNSIDPGMSEEECFLEYIASAFFFDFNGNGFPELRKFERPADELFIQMNRFGFNRETAVAEKINDPVPTPMRFTLPDRFFADIEEPSFEELEMMVAPKTYQADAFLVHIGSYNGGHYISYRRTKNAEGIPFWWKMDDSRVSLVSQAEAEAALRISYNIHYIKV